MGRKKIGPALYEVDFKFPHHPEELVRDGEGKPLMSDDAMLTLLAIREDSYSVSFRDSVSQFKQTHGNITDSQRNTLLSLIAGISPQSNELDTKFFAWYDSREDIKEMYKAVASKTWYMYDRNGQYMNGHRAKDNGYYDRPEGWRMFSLMLHQRPIREWIELHRPLVYDIGDMVVLRDKFVGMWRKDPCYSKVDNTLTRIGTVVEFKDSVHHRSRAGKGSRLVNVLWVNTGETVAVAENTIKRHK